MLTLEARRLRICSRQNVINEARNRCDGTADPQFLNQGTIWRRPMTSRKREGNLQGEARACFCLKLCRTATRCVRGALRWRKCDIPIAR